VLVETAVAAAADLEAIDRAISEEVDREVEAAEKAPLPTPDAALRGVYANGAAEAEPIIVRRTS
jgi:TPP-dependent pyruvate/acetoin dehydrogenase alpha subunit